MTVIEEQKSAEAKVGKKSEENMIPPDAEKVY